MATAFYLGVTDCPPGKEAEFNHWYNEVLVPYILQAPGVVAGTRYEIVGSPQEGQGRFLVVYEIEADDVASARQALLDNMRQFVAEGNMFEGLQLTHSGLYRPITDRMTK